MEESDDVTTQTVNLHAEDHWSRLFTTDALLLYSSAILVVIYSAYRSLEIDSLFKKNDELKDLNIKGKSALMIPIFGSVVLLLFFFFFDFISLFSTIAACFSSVAGFIFTTSPILNTILPNADNREVKLPIFGRVYLTSAILLPSAIAMVLLWLITGHWSLNNTIGISTVVMSISFMRLPSIKIAVIALCGLFLYDIFWVFYSSRFFGENVMVAVATKEASNPIITVAKTLRLPEPTFVIPKLQLPMKLIWGGLMLGLGDILMPGLLIAFALRFDTAKSKEFSSTEKHDLQVNEEIPISKIITSSSLPNIFTTKNRSYFITSVIGYAIGLFLAMTMAFVFQHAQPALLYLVPLTLLPVIFLAWTKGEFSDIWKGNGLGSTVNEEDRYVI